jgi:hypothetical protein
VVDVAFWAGGGGDHCERRLRGMGSGFGSVWRGARRRSMCLDECDMLWSCSKFYSIFVPSRARASYLLALVLFDSMACIPA